jgi:hypothetical protein
MTVAKITSVTRAQGDLAAFWEFSYIHSNSVGTVFEGTIALHEASCFACRKDSGPVAEMCRTIGSTPFAEFSWLVGRVFKRKLDDAISCSLPEASPN